MSQTSKQVLSLQCCRHTEPPIVCEVWNAARDSSIKPGACQLTVSLYEYHHPLLQPHPKVATPQINCQPMPTHSERQLTGVIVSYYAFSALTWRMWLRRKRRIESQVVSSFVGTLRGEQTASLSSKTVWIFWVTPFVQAQIQLCWQDCATSKDSTFWCHFLMQ